MPRDPTFAPPAHELAGQGLAPPVVAPAISGGLGLALNDAAQLPDGVLYQVLNNGTLVGARRKLNLIQGSNVTLTITDTPASDRVDVTVASSGNTVYRKTTAKTVNTTVAKTDLLNSEITVAANALSTNKRLTLRANGDWKQNSGGTAAPPRIVFDLGGTTLLDTSVPGGTAPDSATRYGWWVEVTVQETGATNTQSVRITGEFVHGQSASPVSAADFVTGSGRYYMYASASASRFTGWAAGAKDGTGTLAVALSTINGSANANYEVVLKDALVVIE